MKKIGVIGVGSAGIVSLNHFCTWLDNSWEIVSIYDPAIKTLGVGESTNANFVKNLETGIDFTILKDLDTLDGTLKYGTKFIDWRVDEWVNPLIEGAVAVHFDTNKLKDFVLPRLKEKWGEKFRIIEGTVTEVLQDAVCSTIKVDDTYHTFDFIIDCRGFPTDFSDYNMSNCSLVNHCLVHDHKTFNPVEATEHWATKNGWMFGVPLQTRCSYGYLYNDEITSKDDAIADMSDLLNVPVDELTTREYEFKPYYAKKFLDGRILKNGNRAIFFEPISATSIYMYVRICSIFCDFLLGKYNSTDVNQSLRNDIEDLETLIRYYYHGGSNYNTTFWKKAKSSAIEQLKGDYKFYRLVTNYVDLVRKQIPYSDAGMIFNPSSWHQLDKNFKFNYFTEGNTFPFDMARIDKHLNFLDDRHYEETVGSRVSEFKENGWLHIKNCLEPLTVDLVTSYARFDEEQNFQPEEDGAQIPGAHSKYADPLMESLLLQLKPIMEKSTGLSLYPTYSYFRVYRPGDTLAPHKDRSSCEVSTTVCFYFDYKEEQDTYSWPIYMDNKPCVMAPGDLIVYRGCDLEHWRDEFKAPKGSWHVQAFFHYVDADGPFESFKFDGRPYIGYLSEEKKLYHESLKNRAKLPAPVSKKYISFTNK